MLPDAFQGLRDVFAPVVARVCQSVTPRAVFCLLSLEKDEEHSQGALGGRDLGGGPAGYTPESIGGRMGRRQI